MVAKRKSDALASSSNKKARIDTSNAEALVHSILSNPSDYVIPDNDDDIRQSFVDLANYASYLRDSVVSVQQAGSSVAPASKTPEQLADAAEKVAKAARSGIKKQMTVRLDDLSTCMLFDALFSSGKHPARRAVRNSITMGCARTQPYSDTC